MKKNWIKKYAEGGVAEAPMDEQAAGAEAPVEEVPAEEGAGAAQEQMMQQLAQIIQTQDPNLALQFCNQLAEQANMAGQAAPAPAGGEGVPMNKKGGKVVKVSAYQKLKNGGKI